ncbi:MULTISPECIES: hypothetical protein [Sporosarcina]|uniref:hypothetical protein n=1 Tax=Sporosarcina TaxID=1569 RepID=UPI00117B4675|nr:MULTISPECIES: hypothetical protein [Sporosarcina]
MVGVVMRQPGALPVWLIAEAIHHRRSGANDRPTYTFSQTTTSAKNKEKQGFAKPLPNIVSDLLVRTNNPYTRKTST